MIRMFLTPKDSGPIRTGRREKSDHTSVEAAQAAFAADPRRSVLEALIYIDGAPAWVGNGTDDGGVDWQPWRL